MNEKPLSRAKPALMAVVLAACLASSARGQGGRLPVIFIGAAYQDRLEQLRDRSQWPVVAARSGMFIHPNNINRGSKQLEVTKAVAPLFGIRQAVIERNSLPTAEDIPERIRMTRETLGFKDGVYFYFNGITASRMVKPDGVTPPDPAWWDRGRLAADHGAVPLYGPAPHVVFRRPEGWNDKGWDFLRDLSVFKGYCFDAPAELYVRDGKDAAAKAAGERYRESVARSIIHARKNGCRTIYLFSAHGTAAENVANAREVVRDLKRRDALPWAWAIEDYTRDSKLPMVPERNADGTPADTVTGLAFWILGFHAGKFQ